MARIFGVLFAGAIATGVGIWMFLAKPDQFITACKAEISRRLLSPSTYKQIKVEAFDKEIGRDEYKAMRELEMQKMKTSAELESAKNMLNLDLFSIDEGRYKPVIKTAVIEFDADNSFGTPIRQTALCTYETRVGKNEVSEFLVEVDGQTRLEYLAEQIKRSGG